MNILGISAFYHGSAACLVQDGEIIAAAQEEWFTRKKHDASFPKNAVAFCLKQRPLHNPRLPLRGMKFNEEDITYPFGARSLRKNITSSSPCSSE